jgi:hypothetical protein
MKSIHKKPSDNELGEYLPDSEAQPFEQSEPIMAVSEPLAKKKCEELAAEYGGLEPQVEKSDAGKNAWDCKFTLWG